MRPKKSNKTSRTLGVRFIPEDAKLMAKVCEARGEDLSVSCGDLCEKNSLDLDILQKKREKRLEH